MDEALQNCDSNNGRGFQSAQCVSLLNLHVLLDLWLQRYSFIADRHRPALTRQSRIFA